MKLIQSIVVIIALASICAFPAYAADHEGVAIAIVYDTSGSMNDPVKDGSGKATEKYRIANRALVAIANRIQSFATNGVAGTPRKIQTALYIFQDGEPHAVIPFGPFDARAIKQWARGFSSPGGGTPLGDALNVAGRVVLDSGLARKHVLIITDGENTVGRDPADILPGLLKDASRKQAIVGVHFVAFDVDAKVFEGVKKQGATVVGASNEAQLNTQLEFILEKKILLEDEDPPKQK